ncbi:hypothetical protein RB594_004998 [Gaeumannomyces avenae]
MASRGLGGSNHTMNITASQGSQQGRASMATSGSAVKARQLLAQLSANLADTENLLRMTSVQAEAMRGLGSWHAGMFMAASKLGEEAVRDQQQGGQGGE